jgi:hypothetical protein
MKKTALILSFALASLLGASAFAQKDVPGEGKAASVPAATKAEKLTAKEARKKEGKEVVKSGAAAGEDKPVSAASGQKVAKADKQAAKASRKKAGKDVVKSKEAKKPDSSQ